MSEILLVRHAQSYANKRDFAVFGNEESPLTDKGIEQAVALNGIFKSRFSVIPEDYSHAVASSEYVRPQQTAMYAGFDNIDILPAINEADVSEEIASGFNVIEKHCVEGWIPEEVSSRAEQFVEDLLEDGLEYEIYFTHGMFIAGVLTHLSYRNIVMNHDFDERRGYIPMQASITRITN